MVVDFINLDIDFAFFGSVDAVFCCIGTTIKQAGSEAAFQVVDYEIPMSIARLARAAGCGSFFLISSSKASSDSIFFYLQVKGRLEDDLSLLGFDRLVVYRPALLAGKRSSFRFFEYIMGCLFRWFSFMIPKKYNVIDANDLATKMVENYHHGVDGAYVIERECM